MPRWMTTSPCFEVHFVVVEEHRHFAFEHDRVVEGLGAMHERVALVLRRTSIPLRYPLT